MKTLAEQLPEPVLTAAFARDYIITMRPYLLFVSGITGIAGMAAGNPVSFIQAAAIAIASFLAYGFGQALTDCFQTDTDSISSPYRPLTQGRISVRAVLLVSLCGLAGVGAVFVSLNPVNLVLAALGTAGLATYTWFKRLWWAGPFYNAWIVVVLFLMGYFSTGAALGSPEHTGVLAGSLPAVFFGYANFVLTGYFKDVSADRKTGYRTLPVVHGLKLSIQVSDIFAVLTLLGIFIVLSEISHAPGTVAGTASLIFAAAGAVAAVIAQLRLKSIHCDQDAHRAIAPVVHAYILLLSAITAACRPDSAIMLIVFYGGYCLTLKLRPMKAQI